tara:strand:+ start:595 stop:1059 length:465 start_codon:yes stop_codon:yes gene_type:complete
MALLLVSNGQIAAALLARNGNQVHVAKMLGVSRSTIQKRVAESEMLQEATWQAKEALTDRAEAVVQHAIDEGSLDAAKFHLREQGKGRGYGVQRTEVTGKDGEPIELKPIHAPPRPETYKEWAEQTGMVAVEVETDPVEQLAEGNGKVGSNGQH